eukprot:2145261-Alexandrium_andersonii.AAC.1
MSQALEEIRPGHAKWCRVGMHGTKVEFVQSIIRTGLDTQFSAGRDKRCHIHMVAQLARDG